MPNSYAFNLYFLFLKVPRDDKKPGKGSYWSLVSNSQRIVVRLVVKPNRFIRHHCISNSFIPN